MPLTALAVVPATPLLVPAVAARSDPALEAMRAAVHEALRRLLATGPGRVLVVAAASTATFAGLGVPLGEDPAAPLPVALGRWLLRESGWAGEVVAHAVGEDDTAVGEDDTTAVGGPGPQRDIALVLAEGSNRRGPASPGADDPRAAGVDSRLLGAIRSDAPVPALAALRADPAVAGLGLGSFGPLVVGLGWLGREEWTAETLYDAAPFGVGSFVVVRVRA